MKMTAEGGGRGLSTQGRHGMSAEGGGRGLGAVQNNPTGTRPAFLSDPIGPDRAMTMGDNWRNPDGSSTLLKRGNDLAPSDAGKAGGLGFDVDQYVEGNINAATDEIAEAQSEAQRAAGDRAAAFGFSNSGSLNDVRQRIDSEAAGARQNAARDARNDGLKIGFEADAREKDRSFQAAENERNRQHQMDMWQKQQDAERLKELMQNSGAASGGGGPAPSKGGGGSALGNRSYVSVVGGGHGGRLTPRQGGGWDAAPTGGGGGGLATPGATVGGSQRSGRGLI